jgi:transcriptional regulator with XRE-family HTH domain
MPRPPSKTHVLRTVRALLNLSQDVLAKRAGIASITVRRIENCSLPMSEEIASRLSGYTGVDRIQLLRNSDPSAPRNIWGEPFAKTWFENTYAGEAPKQAIGFWLGYLAFIDRSVVNACADEKPKAVNSLLAAMFSAVRKLVEDYELRAELPGLAEYIDQREDPYLPGAGHWIKPPDVSAAKKGRKAKSAKKPKRQPL